MSHPPYHATCLALITDTESWGGILLRGASGSGKSDLALRLLTSLTPDCARLVADDYVALQRGTGTLLASAPASIAGLLEVRGLGIVTMACLEEVPVVLAFDLSDSLQIDRLPDPCDLDLGDLTADLHIPVYRLNPFHPSASAKVIMTFAAVTGKNPLISSELAHKA